MWTLLPKKIVLLCPSSVIVLVSASFLICPSRTYIFVWSPWFACKFSSTCWSQSAVEPHSVDSSDYQLLLEVSISDRTSNESSPSVSSISADSGFLFSIDTYILHPINYLFTDFIRDVSTIHFWEFNLLLLCFLMSACWSVHNIHQKVIQSKFLRRGLLVHKNCKVTGWNSYGKCPFGVLCHDLPSSLWNNKLHSKYPCLSSTSGKSAISLSGAALDLRLICSTSWEIFQQFHHWMS